VFFNTSIGFIFLSNLTNPPRFDHGLERKGKRVTEVIRP
jgi:hypothetical protein